MPFKLPLLDSDGCPAYGVGPRSASSPLSLSPGGPLSPPPGRPPSGPGFQFSYGYGWPGCSNGGPPPSDAKPLPSSLLNLPPTPVKR